MILPIWLQLTAAVSSAVISFVMGIALIPFLEKCRFYMPDVLDTESAGNQLRPTMCGIVLIMGTVLGFVLTYTLYLQFGGVDRTSTAFQSESHMLWLAALYMLLLGFAGWIFDYLTIKRKRFYPVRKPVLFLAVWFVGLAVLRLFSEDNILDFGAFQWNAGLLAVPVRAAVLAVCWLCMQETEQETDGMSITLSQVLLLFLTVLLLIQKQNIYALYSLTVAGACMGCLYWNLHPAKCRLGCTGTSWLGSVLPMVCILYGKYHILVLYMAVYVINILPVLVKKPKLITAMKEQSPLQRIMLLAGFAVFCGILSVMLERT